MPARDFVLVVIIDLVAVLGVAGFVARVLRRGSTPSAPVPRAGVLLAAAAAVLLLVAIPLPWTRATGRGHGLATLIAEPASSLLGWAAIVLSVAALGMGARLGLRGGSRVVAVTDVVLGTAWCLIALDSLLLTSGVNRATVGSGHLAAGPAVWLCLVSGLVALAAGAIATRGSAPVALAPPAAPQAPARVDEWGTTGPSAPHQTGDQW